MTLSAQATALFDALARDQGLKGPLRLDGGRTVSVTLGEDGHVSIAYSPANDSVTFTGVLDPAGRAGADEAWTVLAATGDLAARRTRVARDPDGGQTLLVCEVFLAGLDYPAFSRALERFALDLDAVSARLAAATRAKPAAATTEALPSDWIMIRA